MKNWQVDKGVCKMIKIIVIQTLKEIIWKNNLNFDILKRLKYLNFDVKKQRDGYNIMFEKGKYFLYVIDEGMGRASQFQEARNQKELIYLIIYEMTLNIVNESLQNEESRMRIFKFQEKLLYSVNDKWYESSKKYHNQINEVMLDDSTFYKFYAKDIRNRLLY